MYNLSRKGSLKPLYKTVNHLQLKLHYLQAPIYTRFGVQESPRRSRNIRVMGSRVNPFRSLPHRLNMKKIKSKQYYIRKWKIILSQSRPKPLLASSSGICTLELLNLPSGHQILVNSTTTGSISNPQVTRPNLFLHSF